MEQWKPIAGFEGLYEVSDLGRVRSLDRVVQCDGGPHAGLVTKHYRGRMLALTPSEQGYINVHLSGNGQHYTGGVHVLVAREFIPNPRNLPEVDHKTKGKAAKSDNRVTNLQWVTSARNIQKSFEQGRLPLKGIEVGNSKLTPSQVKQIRQQYAAGDRPQHAIAAEFGICQAHVSDIVTRKRWSYV